MITIRKLAIECEYSESVGFQITGSVRALTEFAEILEVLQEGVYELASSCLRAVSFEASIDQLILKCGQGRVKVDKEGLSIVISGDPGLVLVLAGNIRDFALEGLSSEEGSHMHVEYYEGHIFLDSTAEPVIVFVRLDVGYL